MPLQIANEVELKKLMLAGLAGDAKSCCKLLERIRSLLRTYYRLWLLRIGRVPQTWRILFKMFLLSFTREVEPTIRTSG